MNNTRSPGFAGDGVSVRAGDFTMLSVGLACSAPTDCPVTVGLMIGVLAIDRPWPAETGAERDANGADDDTIRGGDAVGDSDKRDDGPEEVALATGVLFRALGVGDIGSAVAGVADKDLVGADGTVVGGTDESGATVSGLEAAIADPAASGLSTEAFPSPDSWACWVLKAELRSAVIRWYIRLGLTIPAWEDVFAVDGEDDLATAGRETFAVPRVALNAAGCRIAEGETGGFTVVILIAFRGGIVPAEGLVEMLEVGS